MSTVWSPHPPSLTPLAGQVEFPVLRPADERRPLLRGEDQRRSGGVLAVQHRNGVAQLGKLDAGTTVTLAAAGLPPYHVGHVGVDHARLSSIMVPLELFRHAQDQTARLYRPQGGCSKTAPQPSVSPYVVGPVKITGVGVVLDIDHVRSSVAAEAQDDE